VGDEQGSVNGAHAKSGDVLHEELLDLRSFGEGVINDDCRDPLETQEASRQCPALPLDQEVVTRIVWRAPDGDRREHAELLDRPTEFSVAISVTLPSQTLLRADALN
jgi:hypothetical protein